MSKLCRCGAIVEKRCPSCDKAIARGEHHKTTAQRGYDHRWRTFSERYRADYPLCQVCLLEKRVKGVTQLHHIEKIAERPDLRLQRSNVLSVCDECHPRAERDKELSRKAKLETSGER